MKNISRIIGIIALVAVVGFGMLSCDVDPTVEEGWLELDNDNPGLGYGNVLKPNEGGLGIVIYKGIGIEGSKVKDENSGWWVVTGTKSWKLEAGTYTVQLTYSTGTKMYTTAEITKDSTTTKKLSSFSLTPPTTGELPPPVDTGTLKIENKQTTGPASPIVSIQIYTGSSKDATKLLYDDVVDIKLNETVSYTLPIGAYYVIANDEDNFNYSGIGKAVTISKNTTITVTWDKDFTAAPTTGTLKIEHKQGDGDKEPITSVIIYQGSNDKGSKVKDETVSIEYNASKTYDLAPGNYFVVVDDETNFNYEGIGKAVTISVGTTVTVTWDADFKAATKPVTTVTVSPSSKSLMVGDTETLTVAIIPNDATDKDVTWSSSATGIATVDTSGKVTAVAVGSATITATAKDGSNKTGTCSITVTAAVGTLKIENKQMQVSSPIETIKIYKGDSAVGEPVNTDANSTLNIAQNASTTYTLPIGNYFVVVDDVQGANYSDKGVKITITKSHTVSSPLVLEWDEDWDLD